MNDESGTFSDESVITVSNRHPSKSPVVRAHILHTSVKFIVDTGATVNVLYYDTYTRVCPNVKLYGPCPPPPPPPPPVFPYSMTSPLRVKGYFSTDTEFKNHCQRATFYLLGDESSHNLLCSPTAQALHMIQFAYSTSTPSTLIQQAEQQYPSLFSEETGKIRAVEIKLHIDKSRQPLVQKHMRIPFHVRKDVERELERSLKR